MAELRQLLLTAVVAIIIAIAAAAFSLREKTSAAEDGAVVELQTATGKPLAVTAEIADSEEKRKAGLMFRKSLGSNEGMLFIFPDAAVRNFWMKNTLIPLDIIFIAENMTVVKIHHAMPCKEEPCQLYNSQQPIKYVLEVNNNLTTAYGISKGSNVRIELD